MNIFHSLFKKLKMNIRRIIFLFLHGMNGDGRGYLEPDTINKYGYLENMYKALKANDALEDNNG